MEKERLKYSIERFDHYYDSVNNKSNIILGLSTLIFGSLITVYPALKDIVEFTLFMHIILTFLVALGFSVMFTLIIASIPSLNSNGKSVHFFGTIAKMSLSDFMKKSTQLSAQDEIDDLRSQTYHLAKGLRSKFLKLKIALVLTIIQMAFLVPYILLILTNIKS